MLGGSDVDGPVTNFSVVVGPTTGTLIAQGGAGPGCIAGRRDYFGADSFTFRVDDGSLTVGGGDGEI